MNVSLRPATATDIEYLKRWDEAPHVQASGIEDDWNWEVELGRTPAWREQLMICLDERAVGFVQIIDPEFEETHFWGDIESGCRALDTWIGEEELLGKGIGSRAMRQTIDRCLSDPSVHSILVDPLVSNAAAHRFYERFGFERVERRMFGTDDCFVYRLSRDAWSLKTPGKERLIGDD